MNKVAVFIPETIHPKAQKKIREFATVVTQDTEVLNAKYAVVRNYRVDQELLRRMPNLRTVIKHGAGLDRIDTKLLDQKRIQWHATPGLNANGVAELAISQALRLLRGHDPSAASFLPREFTGRRITILGMGRIGTRVATIAINGFNASVSAYDPFAQNVPPNVELEDRILQAVKSAEALFITCPLSPETGGLVDREILSALSDRAVVINTSRAPIVNNEAIMNALDSGKIHGYAHDFHGEPEALDAIGDKGLLLPSAHIGGATEESLQRTGDAVVRLLETAIKESAV